ncbi:MAG: WbqC family protein [Crocinitomicaceae bacterium]|nr:WbqC family protein [Crocinitomicaceae bacterium]
MIPVLPTAYFGSIAYFKELAKHDKVYIEAKEHFPKQSYRNRCDILGSDGILSLSIPTKKHSGSKTPTDEVILSNDENWRIRHWRSITSAYQSAAYFDYYNIEVKELLFSEESNFLAFNLAITQRIIDWLDLGTEIRTTDEFQPMIENDLRIELTDKNKNNALLPAPYIQVFPSEQSFTMNMSILDAIMCEGPLARNLLIENPIKSQPCE